MEDYRWEDGVLRGGGPYYTAATLVRFIQQGNARSLFEASVFAARQANAQRELAGDAYALAQLLESAWTGEASDAARARIRSFADATDQSARALTRNEQNLRQQIENFDRLKSSLQPVPEPHELQQQVQDAAMKGIFFGGHDPLRIIRDYESAVEHNVNTYNAYWEQTDWNFQDLDYDYGEFEQFGHDVSVGDRAGATPGGGWIPPEVGAPPELTPQGDPIEIEPVSEIPEIGELEVSTQASGFTGPDMGVASGVGAGAGGAAAAGGAFAGAGLGGAGVGGAGAPPGSADLAGGKHSGAAIPGGGQASAAGARVAASAGMRGGMPMAGMMGAPAAQGKGGDDEEYRKKGWLQENDSRGIFGLDEKTTPPVIGED